MGFIAVDDVKVIDYSLIKNSEANNARNTAINISGGSFSIAKIGSATVNFSLSKRKIRPSTRIMDNYTDLLHDLSSRSVIFYDTEAKRSWLIDGEQASLQIMLHRSKVRNDYLQSDVKIAAADPEKKVSAHAAMKINERLQLRKDWNVEKGEETVVWFSKELKVIWETLKELTAYARFEDSRALHLSDFNIGQHITGFEYMNLVSSKAEFQQCPRTVKLESGCGEWPEIAKDPASIVLFAKNFQEVLRPPSRDHLCPRFRELPQGKSYLAAELTMIQRFLPNTRLSWIVPEHLFMECNDQITQPCSCNLVQEFSKSDRSDRKKLEMHWCQGAAIFGSNRRRLQKGDENGTSIGLGKRAISSLMHSANRLILPKSTPSHEDDQTSGRITGMAQVGNFETSTFQSINYHSLILVFSDCKY